MFIHFILFPFFPKTINGFANSRNSFRFVSANEPDDSKDLFPRNYYAVFTVSDGELDCSSNAGRIKLKNKIDKGADIIPCHSRLVNKYFCEITIIL